MGQTVRDQGTQLTSKKSSTKKVTNQAKIQTPTNFPAVKRFNTYAADSPALKKLNTYAANSPALNKFHTYIYNQRKLLIVLKFDKLFLT